MSDKNTVAVHRPGIFKQPNKTHKTGRHRSKGLINKEAKGRREFTIEKKAKKNTENKKDRINKLNQVRKLKRETILKEKRSRGGLSTPPFLVVVTSLATNVDIKLVELLKKCQDLEFIHKENSTLISSKRFKQSYEFISVAADNLSNLLHCCLIADFVIFIIPSEGSIIDSWGEVAISTLFGQGLPSTIFVSMDYSKIPVKKLGDFKKNAMKPLENRFPDHKLLLVESEQEMHILLRNISSQKLSKLKFCEHRPHLFIDSIEFESEMEGGCTGKLRGHLRGPVLTPNALIEIPGWGRYQMSKICTLKNMGNTNEVVIDQIVPADPLIQESLDSEVVVDPMQDEQTWPTEEELKEADLNVKKTVRKNVPKGSSDYQAAWLSDDSDDSVDDSSDDSINEDLKPKDEQNLTDDETECIDVDSSEVLSSHDRDDKYDVNFDMETDLQELEKFKELRMQEMFPDEVDTPMDLPARTRFQKYRGLKSFRTSSWDTRENLPDEYARITKFGNFKSICKKIFQKENSADSIIPYESNVEVHVTNIETKYMESINRPLIAFGLLPFEQRMTVMHFVIRRTTLDRRPIKSKETMSFVVGCFSFTAQPIYSQHTTGNKHKFEKFFPLDGVLVASVYAPTVIPPAPVLMFRRTLNGEDQLVGTGSVLSANPDRVIIKRVVLSGHPFKINTRSAVVRYMFFNREDILWFKPIELKTKFGRRGHIKEPLGTHGHMKCVFDSQLKSQDTILLNLYKRVFPKWSYQTIASINLDSHLGGDEMM